jgi:hypothetical protein
MDYLSANSPKPIPYMGLAQSCALIRTEFRPMWLSCHRVPLYSFDVYLKAFFPTQKPDRELHGKIPPYGNSGGSLRVWIRNAEMTDHDIHKLLKHKMRFMDCAIQFQGQPDVDERILQGLQCIVDNKNSTWIKWLKGNVIKQVRVGFPEFVGGRPWMRFVIKERYATRWMRETSVQDAVRVKASLKDFGLAEVNMTFNVSSGVDYS